MGNKGGKQSKRPIARRSTSRVRTPVQQDRKGGEEQRSTERKGRFERERHSVERFSPDEEEERDTESMPSSSKKGKGSATKSWRAATTKEDLGRFVVHVKNDWRDVTGFQVFEYAKDERVDDDGITTMTSSREWYCSNLVAPPGGFKTGHYGFQPKTKAWTSKFFETVSLSDVNVRQMEMVITKKDGGTLTQKFVEIDDERAVIKKAYKKLPKQDVTDDEEEEAAEEEAEEKEAAEEEAEEEEEAGSDEQPEASEEEEEEKPPARAAKKSPKQSPGKKSPGKQSPGKKTPSKAKSKGIAKKDSQKKKKK